MLSNVFSTVRLYEERLPGKRRKLNNQNFESITIKLLEENIGSKLFNTGLSGTV